MVAAAYPHTIRPFVFPHSDPQVQAVHPKRPTHTLIGSTGGLILNMVKGVPVSANPKFRIYDGSSLYALCRLWLRNGFPEECQPKYANGVKSLPKPSPIARADAYLPVKTDGDKEEEEEGSIEHLPPKDLLQRHIKHAKRVRA